MNPDLFGVFYFPKYLCILYNIMKNLNENIQRIKQMMNTINESSFDKPVEPEISMEIRQGVTNLLNDFIQNPEFVDDYVKTYDGYFIITNEEGDESLMYEFDIDYTQRSSFTPGVMYLPNGDPGYPDEGENAEYDFDITKLIYYKTDEEGGDVSVYEGKDFTGFLGIKLSNGMTGEEFMFEKFDEQIQENEAQIEDDGPEPDDY